MFSINSAVKAHSSIIVRYNKHELEFVIGTIISKRNKGEVDDPHQFTLLNAYLNHKGEEFKQGLFELLAASEEAIMLTITQQGLQPLPYKIVHPVMTYFDLMDIFNFIKNIYRVKAPSNLAESFDALIESDGRGTRVQTYLKDDYYELAALALVVKATIGPITHFAYMKSSELSSIHAEYILMHFYKAHPIYNTPPMQKLLGLSEKLVNLPTNGPEADNIRVLEKQLPKSEMPFYILAIVLIQKVSIATIIEDNEMKNVITKIYNYINNRLKASGDVANTIRNKSALSDPETGGGDLESLVESHRAVAEISGGICVEMDWAVSTIDRVISQLPPKMKEHMHPETLMHAMEFSRYFTTGKVTQTHIDLLAIIFKGILDPRGLLYLKMESIVNLMVVGFTYLWHIELYSLALLIMSEADYSANDEFVFNSTVNRTRIPQNMKDELDMLFPYKRVINETTTSNLVEEWIGNIANEITKRHWIIRTNDHYLEQVHGNYQAKIMPATLKVVLADFIIKHEKILRTVPIEHFRSSVFDTIDYILQNK